MATPLAVATLVAAGCAEPTPVLLSETTSAATVQAAITSGCSTSVVVGLSRQIADEIGCALPGAFVPFEATSSLVFTSSAVLPYLQADGLAALRQVAQTRTVRINSAFRTLAQQYLIVQWKNAGRCGITAAAPVGRSNHESGRALDLSSYTVSAMTGAGWAHNVPGDDPHFEYLASDDLRGQDISAFQRLWNRNHPEDTIATDGVYGSDTEARLKSAPATGFPLGADCGEPPTPPPAGERLAEVVALDGPDRAPPSTRVHVSMAVSNIGQIDWTANTRLVVVEGGAALRDPSWTSGTEITQLGTPTAAGEFAWLDFDITTPPATTETLLQLRLALDDGGARFGAIDLSLTVVPGTTEPTSGEGDDDGDNGEDVGDGGGGGGGGTPELPGDSPDVSGGCDAGRGGGAGGLLGVVLLAGLRLRRRAR